MGDIDTTVEIKKVCTKRVNESRSPQMNTNGDVVLVSDDSVVESPVFSVESISMGSSDGDPMVPITPHSKGEGVDCRLGVDDSLSPLVFPKKLIDCDSKGGGFIERECDSLSAFSSPNRKLLHCDSLINDGGLFSEDSPCTPKKDVFNPFAPGPDKLNLAPYRRKYTEELKFSVARKLQFDLCTKFTPDSEDVAVSEEEMLFQSVYSDILEAIISTQDKENGKVSFELPLSDGCRTPVRAPRLSGVSDTCPGAPVKGSNRCRRIDKEIIRKLEF
ncbi:hypothetical protein LIER_41601 [Lithospermum erythrorhizon]|uniref:Uncharacterized protein n=1 Tax=Lithospermum erythrorhizon TaxID=34254 RepID=A0AAV3RBS2_LITER